MWRLIRLVHARHERGPEPEHGAIAVMVALLMVVLLGLTAFAVDTGRLVSAKAQLQNGADAGALAAAKYCSLASAPDCASNASGVAAPYAPANSQGNVLAGSGLVPTGGVTFPTSNEVTVTTATPPSGLSMIFAGVIGIPTAQVSATATAQWGGFPLTGPAALPMTFPACKFDPASTALQFIYNKPKAPDKWNTCVGDGQTGHAPNISGSFYYLNPDTGTCTATISPGPSGSGYGTVNGNTGANPPCSATDYDKMLGQTVLIPIFSDPAPPGGKGQFIIREWAAFIFLGYKQNGSSEKYYEPECPNGNKGACAIQCLSGNDCQGIVGRFVKFLTYDPRFVGGGVGADHGVTLPPKLIIR